MFSILQVTLDNDLDKFVILASDGLWDIYSGQQCVDMVKELDEESIAVRSAEYLLKKAVQAEKCYDNIAVIVIKL
tara:strand:- start:134 stop:358 length:225 start_codon:yes stop_codon:yes gene_type:complete